MIPQTIHGHPVFGWYRTEIQDDKECGIVLVKTKTKQNTSQYGDHDEWVVAWYRQGDEGWIDGNYKYNQTDAYFAFVMRVLNSLPIEADRFEVKKVFSAALGIER